MTYIRTLTEITHSFSLIKVFNYLQRNLLYQLTNKKEHNFYLIKQIKIMFFLHLQNLNFF
jgi:hypothetical protein